MQRKGEGTATKQLRLLAKMSSNVVVNPLTTASAGAAAGAGEGSTSPLSTSSSQAFSPLSSSPSAKQRPRKSVAAFLGLEGQQRRDSELRGLDEPDWKPSAILSKFADETARQPTRFTIDMLLAVSPSLLALYTVFDDQTGARNIYFDGCTSPNNSNNNGNGTAPSIVEVDYFQCVRCNNDSPRFGVAYPASARPALIAFSIISSIFLSGATYGLNILKDRAIHYLAHGVYISSTARRNWLSALWISIFVIGLSVLQVYASQARQADFSAKTLGPNGLCNVPGPYLGVALTPTFRSGNPTVVTSLFSAASAGALVASLFYFLLNTVLSQAFTIRALCEGPSNLYTDASFRTALKKQNTTRRIQDCLHWQVLAIDLDNTSVKVLLELSITERPKRRLSFLRILFSPLIVLNFFGSYAAFIGVHPFDRTYRKKEWQNRTIVEEILHRLWAEGKITKFRVRDRDLVMPPLPAGPAVAGRAAESGAPASVGQGKADPQVGGRKKSDGGEDGPTLIAIASGLGDDDGEGEGDKRQLTNPLRDNSAAGGTASTSSASPTDKA